MKDGFAERLSQAMALKRVRSAAALARLIEMHPNSCREFVAGVREPSDANLRKIADALDVSLEWLKNGDSAEDQPVIRDGQLLIQFTTEKGIQASALVRVEDGKLVTVMSNPEGISFNSMTYVG